MNQEDNNFHLSSLEASYLSEFISNISQEKYAAANKYLQELLDAKLKARIQAASKKEIF
jgi:ABC-type bacteriocin/lantibiotic exporter with double-glycine peptidase domain